MSASSDAVYTKASQLPDTPGVYLWKNAAGQIIYIGKAKRLRRRVISYLAKDSAHPRTRQLVQDIADFEWIGTPTEVDALALEETLIKRHRPRYNVALVDEGGYPYLKITLQEAFPRVLITRRLDPDGAKYIGPFMDPGRLRALKSALRHAFQVRTCHYDLPVDTPSRPCLEFHIKKCQAPCVFRQTQTDYRAMIQDVISVAEGKTDALLVRLQEDMQKASTDRRFERAAELRDQIKILAQKPSLPVTSLPAEASRDVLGVAKDGPDACVVWLQVRQGKVVGRELRLLEGATIASDEELIWAYLRDHWHRSPDRTRTLVLPAISGDLTANLALWPEIKTMAPSRGPWHTLLEMATQNARALLDDLRLDSGASVERTNDAVADLQTSLNLDSPPRTMVCFDISHGAGRETVASCVRFANGRPDKRGYRTYNIKTVEGIDDFASIYEAVSRWAARVTQDEIPAPDLILIDGGREQLKKANQALCEQDLGDILVISLAKREEEVYRLDTTVPLRLSRRSKGLLLLQQIRDEAHRFAVSAHRRRRQARTTKSVLQSVPGLGPMKIKALLTHFGSPEAVRQATPENIAALPGFTLTLARRIQSYLDASKAPKAVSPGSAKLSAEDPSHQIVPPIETA